MEKKAQTLEEWIDALASTDEFTNYKSILSNLPECVNKEKRKKEYDRLRTIVTRLFDQGYIEKRKKPNGFRYKKEHQYYFARKRQKDIATSIMTKSGHEASKLYLTDGLNLLMEGERADEPKYQLEYISELRNGDLIKKLELYLGCYVIQFNYLEKFETEVTIIFSPHLLKEYNSRWNIVGFRHCDKEEPYPTHIPIDRIVRKHDQDGQDTTFKKLTPIELEKLDITFKTVSPGFFKQRYRDVVGMTIYPDMETELVCLKTHSYQDHMYLKTKPIHPSQTEVHLDLKGNFIPWENQTECHFDRENNEGYFTLEVKINFELRAKLLGFGAGVSVVAPESFVDNIKKLLTKMASRYGLRCTDS